MGSLENFCAAQRNPITINPCENHSVAYQAVT